MSSAPRSLGRLTPLECQLGRRVQYLRPPALPGTELTWFFVWGRTPPAAIDHRYQLVRIDRSDALVRCGAAEHRVTNGKVAVAAPYTPAIVAKRDSAFSQVRVASVEPTLVDLAIDPQGERLRGRTFQYVTRDARTLRAALDALFSAVLEGTSALTQQSLLLACLCAAAETLGGVRSEPAVPAMPRRIQRALEFIQEHFTDEITLDDLTAAAGGDVHPRYLLTVFKREVGVAPHQYVIRLRIRKARELLARGISASSAAVAVGFCDASQLHGHFVRIVGMTPSAYAKAVH